MVRVKRKNHHWIADTTNDATPMVGRVICSACGLRQRYKKHGRAEVQDQRKVAGARNQENAYLPAPGPGRSSRVSLCPEPLEEKSAMKTCDICEQDKTDVLEGPGGEVVCRTCVTQGVHGEEVYVEES